MNEAVQRAVRSFGSQVAMASALQVKQPTISEWLRGERRVPAEQCPRIERGTRERNAEDGANLIVTCEELRPDVAWEVLREQALPAANDAPDTTPGALDEPQAAQVGG